MYQAVIRVFLAVVCTLALATTQARAARICSMKNAEVSRGKIKTYNGSVLKMWDESDTPAMQPRPKVQEVGVSGRQGW